MIISPEIYRFNTDPNKSQAIRQHSVKIDNGSVLSYSYPNPDFLEPDSDLFIGIYIDGKNTHIAHADNSIIIAQSVEDLAAGNFKLVVADPDGDGQYIPLEHSHSLELLKAGVFKLVILN